MRYNYLQPLWGLMLLTLALIMSPTVSAQDAVELMKQAHLKLYYAGDDGKAEVVMHLIDKGGKERLREFTMLRIDNADGGNQKYYTYFRKPSDVSRLSFMVHKSADGNDSRWIYVPAVDLVKPISADDKNSSFVGSDFTYEDVSGRHWSEDNHTMKDANGKLDGKDVYIIESVPVKEYKGYARKVSYIDKALMLPLKEEYFDKKGELTRIFRADKVQDIEGITTVTSRSIENVKKGSRTVVEFTGIDYNMGLTDELFTERYLKNPPREYIQ